jgi:hypothetical protein
LITPDWKQNEALIPGHTGVRVGCIYEEGEEERDVVEYLYF